MEITAAMVKKLRDTTGAGMMDCKTALSETDGDMEKAIDFLRKKGAATAEKRSDRAANEGAVITEVNNGEGIIIEINCETDFVARSDDFLSFGKAVAGVIRDQKPESVPQLLDMAVNGLKVSDMLNDTIGKIGEKIEVKRFATFKTEGTIIEYIHPGSKLGVMVELVSPKTGDEILSLGKDIAMQIAAMNPVAIDRTSVPKDMQEKELEIYRDQARQQGKPENLIERIAEGKLNKYFQEYTLLEQSFIRDNTKTVSEHIADVAKALDADIKVARFERFSIGEDN